MGPSICALVRRARELRAEGATTADEVSPPGDAAANGVAERANLTFGGLVRTTKAAVAESVLVVQLARVSWRGWCVMPPSYMTPAQSVQMGPHRFDVCRDARTVHWSLGFVSKCCAGLDGGLPT